MTILRIAGVMSIALLTMGSGGVKRSAVNDTSDATASQSIEASSPTDAVPSDVAAGADVSAGTDAEGAAVRSAASEATGSGAGVSPAISSVSPDSKGALELAISNDYIQGRYYTDGGLLGFDDAKGHVGLYFSDNRDVIANIGLMSDPTQVFVDGLTISAGARGYLAFLSNPSDDVVGLAPGVEARFALPYSRPMSVVGNVFYAPDILTLGDAEDILDLDLRFEAQLIPSTVGFIGYREFRFDSDEGGDKKAASEIQVGGRYAF